MSLAPTFTMQYHRFEAPPVNYDALYKKAFAQIGERTIIIPSTAPRVSRLGIRWVLDTKPTFTLWVFIPPRKTFELEGESIAPIIHPIHYTAQHIAQRLNFPHETDSLYFETEEQAKEHLANYLAAQEVSQ